jgi:ABC-2 type transport system ATP-binding protein
MAVIAVQGLGKCFGDVVAVDDLSFEVDQGTVTGFLGPNGAGKTTTLRMLLGLVTPTTGTATIGGRAYRELAEPIREVGAVLEATGFYPGRTARDHLRVLGVQAGLHDSAGRADELLGLVGLADADRRQVEGFSLGMRQRLGLAAALLGDPRVLVLDEPANGLDPEGIHWLRGFLRHLAGQGRTVLVSSHALAEVAQSADEVVIIARGRLVAHSTLEALTARATPSVLARSPDAAALHDLLTGNGVKAELAGGDRVTATDTSTEAVGRLAASGGLVLYELRLDRSNLEDVFLELTADDDTGQEQRPWGA